MKNWPQRTNAKSSTQKKTDMPTYFFWRWDLITSGHSRQVWNGSTNFKCMNFLKKISSSSMRRVPSTNSWILLSGGLINSWHQCVNDPPNIFQTKPRLQFCLCSCRSLLFSLSASLSSLILEVSSAANALICLALRVLPLIHSLFAHWADSEVNAVPFRRDHRGFRKGQWMHRHSHTYICRSTPTDTLTHKHTEIGGEIWNTCRIKTLEMGEAKSQRDFWALSYKDNTFTGLNISKTFQMSHSSTFKFSGFMLCRLCLSFCITSGCLK